MKYTIPSYVKPFLWSYDTKKLDIKKNRNRVVTNVLNLGTKRAVRWLFSVYNNREIKNVIRRPKPGEWSDKSLHFWSLLFNVKPRVTRRRLK